jgi:hypothetical protein
VVAAAQWWQQLRHGNAVLVAVAMAVAVVHGAAAAVQQQWHRKPTINQMDYTAPPKTPCRQRCNTKQRFTNNAPSTNAPSMTLIKK